MRCFSNVARRFLYQASTSRSPWTSSTSTSDRPPPGLRRDVVYVKRPPPPRLIQVLSERFTRATVPDKLLRNEQETSQKGVPGALPVFCRELCFAFRMTYQIVPVHMFARYELFSRLFSLGDLDRLEICWSFWQNHTKVTLSSTTFLENDPSLVFGRVCLVFQQTLPS